MQGVGASETARQIVEFEELVSRLDRINDVVIRRPSATTATTTTTTSTSVPPASSPLPSTPRASSLPYDYLAGGTAARSPVDEEQRVRVHIGIDEDLRMILEMDPSIVDGTPGPPGYPTVARPLRATRPQGWYCTDRD